MIILQDCWAQGLNKSHRNLDPESLVGGKVAEVCGKRKLLSFLPFKKPTFKFRGLTVNVKGGCPW